MKTKQVTLIAPREDDLFEVVSGQDQTEFLPGRLIRKSEVDGLCRNQGWKVKIIQGKQP